MAEYLTKEEFKDAIGPILAQINMSQSILLSLLTSKESVENAIDELRKSKIKTIDALTFQPMTDEQIDVHRKIHDNYIQILENWRSNLR